MRAQIPASTGQRPTKKRLRIAYGTVIESADSLTCLLRNGSLGRGGAASPDMPARTRRRWYVPNSVASPMVTATAAVYPPGMTSMRRAGSARDVSLDGQAVDAQEPATDEAA